MKHAFLIALSLLLLSSILFPYEISGKVRGSGVNNPILGGTTVELWDKGYLVASGVTDSFGKYSMQADAGTYLLVFRRGSYPDHVYSLPVSSNTARDAVMQKQPFVYGRVSSPASLSGKEITLLTGGFVFAKSSLQDDGEYVFPPVPAGEYTISVKFGDYSKSELITVPDKASFKFDLELDKIQTPDAQATSGTAESAATLTLPETAGLGQAIDAVLLKGGIPAAGAQIDIQTPIGQVTQTTDSAGRASIVASDYGVYRFSYGGISYLVYVLPPEGQAFPEPQSPPAEQQAAPEEIQAKGNAAFLFFAVGFVLAIILILALLIFLFKRSGKWAEHKKQGEKKEAESQRVFVPEPESQTTLENYPAHSHKRKHKQ